MSDFNLIEGFEDVWRPVARSRALRPATVLRPTSGTGEQGRARLARLVARAPEVMVKVTGRTRDATHLRAHLDYISRNGELPLEAADGVMIEGRTGARDIGDAWAFEALHDPRRRIDSPMSHSIILSMPAGTDTLAVRDAARAFAADVFAGRHDYVFTLHTDTPRPHVHLSVCSRGLAGQRLNPRKADLDTWRQRFALALRDRGVAAEATPRRARGVVRKNERMPVRKMSDRGGDPSRVTRSALKEAARFALGSDRGLKPWERRAMERQRQIRELYVRQANVLAGSPDPADRLLAAAVMTFVETMPAPVSRRLELARALRAANAREADATTAPPESGRDKER